MMEGGFSPGVVVGLHVQPSPGQHDDDQVKNGRVEQEREGNREDAPSQHGIRAMGVEVVDLPDERDTAAVHQAAQQVADDGTAFLALEEEVEPSALDDRERREHDGQLTFAGEVGPVMANDEEDGCPEEHDRQRAQGESEGTGVGGFFWVACQDAFTLTGIDEAIRIPSRRFLGQPFAETFGEGHEGKIARQREGGRRFGG